MKYYLPSIILFLQGFLALGQEYKPQQGNFGIGYQIRFDGAASQNLVFSYYLTDKIEVGLGIGFNYVRMKTEDVDSFDVPGITGTVNIVSTNTDTRTSLGITLMPSAVKHLSIASDLDCFIGLGVPITISLKTTDETNANWTGTDYQHQATVLSKSPMPLSLGLSAILGCNYFFYRNLAIGATLNLGAALSQTKGDATVESSSSDTGANNPLNGTTTSSTITTPVNISILTVGTLSNVGLGLTFYF